MNSFGDFFKILKSFFFKFKFQKYFEWSVKQNKEEKLDPIQIPE
jgi:hypothetical protein